jgi:response regulator RpfG family c-di-GMP phosphodiesterase
VIASSRFDYRRQDPEASVLAQVPARTFGDTAWVSLALKNCVLTLAPAIRSGKPHRIANAVRAIAHAPTLEQIDDIIGAACDSMLSEGYANRDARIISNVASARKVIRTVVGELRDDTEINVAAPALARETVSAYVRIVALIDPRLAERLETVGKLAARIASELSLTAPLVLETELAGRLHAVGMLANSGTTESIENHPITGAAFLAAAPGMAHLAPIVRSHRERFDGHGVPEGLSGAEIPLPSRIINVAAFFVDLVTGSAAREAMLPNAACHELALRSGSEFDPDVVNATLHLLRYRQRTHRSA